MTSSRRVSARNQSGKKLRQAISVGPHELVADEPLERGGDDQGPSPFEWLAGGLAACTVQTVKAFADKHTIQLRQVTVDVQVVHDGERLRFEKVLAFEGPIDDAQRDRLVEASKTSAVHQALMGAITLVTRTF